MGQLSAKLRKWVNPVNGDEGLIYFCQGCKSSHQIRTKGIKSWVWNNDTEKPVFTPSVKVTGVLPLTDDQHDAWLGGAPLPKPVPMLCHTFVGCNGARPGEVIFLGDCTHSLAGKVLPFPDLPDWMQDRDE